MNAFWKHFYKGKHMKCDTLGMESEFKKTKKTKWDLVWFIVSKRTLFFCLPSSIEIGKSINMNISR